MSADGVTTLCWDIDGTLLTTGRAGILALESAFEEVVGRPVDLTELVASGLTEHEVAHAVFSVAQFDADDQLLERFLRSYERHLPAALPRRHGRVLPGVRDVLEDLSPRTDVRNLILTGNTPAGARAKLAHYGLLEFFADGAYCVGPEPRTEIALRAASLADGSRSFYVIGDTPNDIACGKAIGARTIAVATGSHDRAELSRHDPWRVISEIPDPQTFRSLVGIS